MTIPQLQGAIDTAEEDRLYVEEDMYDDILQIIEERGGMSAGQMRKLADKLTKNANIAQVDKTKPYSRLTGTDFEYLIRLSAVHPDHTNKSLLESLYDNIVVKYINHKKLTPSECREYWINKASKARLSSSDKIEITKACAKIIGEKFSGQALGLNLMVIYETLSAKELCKENTVSAVVSKMKKLQEDTMDINRRDELIQLFKDEKVLADHKSAQYADENTKLRIELAKTSKDKRNEMINEMNSNGLTQQEIAMALKVSTKTVSRVLAMNAK